MFNIVIEQNYSAFMDVHVHFDTRLIKEYCLKDVERDILEAFFYSLPVSKSFGMIL